MTDTNFELKNEADANGFKKTKVLNLYAGLGGNRKLWENVEVTAVEKNPKIAAIYKKLYPKDEIIVGDAHQYLKENFEKFDFVWSSRPCQKHSIMMKFTRHKVADYPDMGLYAEIIFLQHFFKGKWIVENVKPYYEPLIKPTVTIGRHCFWSNFPIDATEIKSPKRFINSTTVAGAEELKKWLGIYFEGNIYYEGNHCPGQVLRNCVHPELGLSVFKSAGFFNSKFVLDKTR